MLQSKRGNIELPKIRTFVSWTGDAKYFWLAFFTNIFALFIALWPEGSEQKIRITGLALQVLGIGTIIWGITETRAFFGHIPIFTKIKNYLRRCPLLNRKVELSASGIMTAPPVIGKARMYETFNPGENPSIESRLSALEKNQEIIHKRISDSLKELDAETQRIFNFLEKEERYRLSEDTDIHNKIEKVGTGGIHISAIGASWFFIGVILSTASPDLYKLLK